MRKKNALPQLGVVRIQELVIDSVEKLERIDTNRKAVRPDFELQEFALLWPKRRSPSGSFELYENSPPVGVVTDDVARPGLDGLTNVAPGLWVERRLRFDNAHAEPYTPQFTDYQPLEILFRPPIRASRADSDLFGPLNELPDGTANPISEVLTHEQSETSDNFFSNLYGDGPKESNEPTQDTPEWHHWRLKGLGSSDAAVLMHKSPWRELMDLWEEKVNPKPKQNTSNWAIERGKRLEPVARDIYEWQTKTEMRPRSFVHKRYQFMRASLDGFNSYLNKGVEFKVPGKVDLEKAKLGECPEKYFAQIQWQMIVSGATEIDYAVLDPDSDKLHIVPVLADHEYQRRLIVLARWFWFLVRNQIKPPMRVVDCAKSLVGPRPDDVLEVRQTQSVRQRRKASR